MCYHKNMFINKLNQLFKPSRILYYTEATPEAYLEAPADKGINDYAFAHFDIKEFRVINEAYGHIAAKV